MQYVMLAREDMSHFLFTSMTGTKVIQRIQVSTLLRGKICAGTILPSFERNWLGFRSLWLVFRIRVYGQVLGLGVQCLVLGFSLQFAKCKQEAANCLPFLKP